VLWAVLEFDSLITHAYDPFQSVVATDVREQLLLLLRMHLRAITGQPSNGIIVCRV